MLFRAITILSAGVLTLLLNACGPTNDVLSNQVPATGARVKFVHAVVDGPAVNVYANEAKLNGTSLTYGNSFPTEYSVLTPGQTNLRVTSVASGTVAETTILTAPASLTDNSYYSVVATGTAAAPVGFLVSDDQSVLNPAKNYIRVLNLLTTGQSVDFAIGTGSPLVSNVPYKGVSDYVPIDPNAAASPYSFQIRNTGTTTLIGTALSFNTLNQGRKYTLVIRGAVGRTGTAAPTLFTYVVK